MYYSEWVKILKEKIKKKDNTKNKSKKLIDRDSEHYPMELV
jgi:hypothetical protein